MSKSYVEMVERASPTVLRGPVGSQWVGQPGLAYTIAADALRGGLRAPYLAEVDGPAYDALTLLGNEAELPQYPGETWANYRARLRSLWTDAVEFSSTPGMLAQFDAAGFTGAEIKTPQDWPDAGEPDYWSQFWIWFPLGTHPVVSSETQTLATETGGTFVVYDAEGLSLRNYRTLQSIIARHKPGHWVCRRVVFEWDPSLIPGLLFWTGRAEDFNSADLGDPLSALGVYAQAGALRPTWNTDAIRSDGTQYLTTTDAQLLAEMGDDPKTIVVRAQRMAGGSVQTLVGFRDSGGAKLTVGFDATNRLFVTRNGLTVTATNADDGADHTHIVTIDGGQGILRTDGAIVGLGTVTTGALTLTAGNIFANGANAQIANARIWGLAIVDGVVSPTLRTQLDNWFADAGADVEQFPHFVVTP